MFLKYMRSKKKKFEASSLDELCQKFDECGDEIMLVWPYSPKRFPYFSEDTEKERGKRVKTDYCILIEGEHVVYDVGLYRDFFRDFGRFDTKIKAKMMEKLAGDYSASLRKRGYNAIPLNHQDLDRQPKRILDDDEDAVVRANVTVPNYVESKKNKVEASSLDEFWQKFAECNDEIILIWPYLSKIVLKGEVDFGLILEGENARYEVGFSRNDFLDRHPKLWGILGRPEKSDISFEPDKRIINRFKSFSWGLYYYLRERGYNAIPIQVQHLDRKPERLLMDKEDRIVFLHIHTQIP